MNIYDLWVIFYAKQIRFLHCLCKRTKILSIKTIKNKQMRYKQCLCLFIRFLFMQIMIKPETHSPHMLFILFSSTVLYHFFLLNKLIFCCVSVYSFFLLKSAGNFYISNCFILFSQFI